MPDRDTLYLDGELQLITCGDLFVERWSAKGSTRALRILIEQHGAFVRRRAPQPTLHLVHIAGSEVAMFDGEIRALIEEHVKVLEGHIAGTAMVYPAVGFGAAAFRLGVTLALAVRRQKHPYQVFAELDPALDWLPEQRPRPADVLRTGAEMRAWYREVEAELAGSA